MMRVLFQEDKIIIQVNKSPRGWIPLWDNEVVAYKVSDIPEIVINMLSDDQVDSIYWFFEDIESRL